MKFGLVSGTRSSVAEIRNAYAFRTACAVSLVFWTVFGAVPNARAVDAGPPENVAQVATRCVVLELYLRSGDQKISTSAATIRKIVEQSHGVRLTVHDLDKQPQSAERLQKIAAAYRLTRVELPLVYGFNHTEQGIADSETWTSRLQKHLTVEMFTRIGCSRCDAAKRYLPAFRAKYPALHVDVLDVIADPQVNQRFLQLARDQRIGGISLPGFWMCQKLIIGFDNEATSGGRLDAVLERWTVPCQLRKMGARHPESATQLAAVEGRIPSFILAQLVISQLPAEGPRLTETSDTEPAPALPIESPDAPPLDIGPETESSSDQSTNAPSRDTTSEVHVVDVPYLGKLSVEKLGMPLFTFLIGLVDGFNPCAMWVLLFLLSVLVNLQDRRKILAVAGTFVFISGAAYFAFMAAWLNVLLLVGFLRWVQIVLAVMALCVGTIHVKDFFAFKKGVTLSIPESAKPGIYSRIRGIVMAEHLLTAIVAASVLAVLVNIVELLCTAGLPALYNQILILQKYPAWENYAYLFLYIVAYMFDDTVMVAIVVITLGKRKLQEHEGRWLKLVSGLVILALGLVLLFKPSWLG